MSDSKAPAAFVSITLLLLLALSATAQESSQIFAAPAVIGSDVDSFRAALDMNGDGDQDALSIWFQGSGTVRVAGWWNDGSGVFTPGWSFTLPLTFSPPLGFTTRIECHVSVGDFNGDGRDDFLFALESVVGWWLSNGDTAPPTIAWLVAFPLQVVDVATADFDGDGLPDAAILTNQELRLYRTQAGMPPALSSTLAYPAFDALRVITAELSGDAVPDVAVLRYSSADLRAVVGGVIQPGQTFTIFTTAAMGIAAGDVDGDGDIDVVAESASNLGTMTTAPQSFMQLLRRTGTASFVAATVQYGDSGFDGGGARTLADADADGDLDLLSMGGTSALVGSTWPATNTGFPVALVRPNDGTGVFGMPVRWHVAGATNEVAVADLDGDGDLDMLAGRCVSYGRPAMGFAPDGLPRNPNGFAAISDFDRDGDLDLGPGIPVVACCGQSAPGTFVNDGSGIFALANTVAPPAPAGTSFIGPGFPGDFDSDGDIDLLVGHSTGSLTNFFEMTLLRNLGGGGLIDGGAATAPGQSMRNVPTLAGSMPLDRLDFSSVLVADVDGDADQDVITLFPASGSYSLSIGSKVWLNNGAGVFVPGQDLPGIVPTAAADVTGDGLPDLVAIQRSAGVPGIASLIVLQGSGTGVFGSTITLAAGLSESYSFDQPAIVDFDGDGDADIVAATPSGLTGYVNQGAAMLFPITIGPLTGLGVTVHLVRSGDVNGDGKLDLLCGASRILTVWIRDPANTGWLPPVTHSADLSSLADVDGDGDLDLVSSAYAVSAGYVSRNTTFPAPTNGLRRQYGSGLAGSGAHTPILGSIGPLRANSSGEFRMTNALGGAAAAWGFGTAQASQPVLGGTLLIVPDFLVPMTLGGTPLVAGEGYGTLPWTLPSGLAGFEVFGQGAVVDGGAAQGYALTQGLRLVIGN